MLNIILVYKYPVCFVSGTLYPDDDLDAAGMMWHLSDGVEEEEEAMVMVYVAGAGDFAFYLCAQRVYTIDGVLCYTGSGHPIIRARSTRENIQHLISLHV